MNLRIIYNYKVCKIIFLPALLLSLSLVTAGQNPGSFYRDRVSTLFNSIVTSPGDHERNLLGDSLMVTVKEFLADDFPFEYKLEGVRYLGQVFSPDSLVKLVSWNIAFLDGTNRYTCFVVRKEGGGTVVTYLESRNGLEGVGADSILTGEDWYGALYYSIIPFNNSGKLYYAVLGLDLNGMFTNRKVIEILSFDAGDGIRFGAPVINTGDGLHHRMLFTYSSEVSMMLRYEAGSGRIVFDHLSPSEPSFAGIYQYYGPDFSYDALEIREGIWWLMEDIDLRNMER